VQRLCIAFGHRLQQGFSARSELHFCRICLTIMIKHMPFEAGITTKCFKADMACWFLCLLIGYNECVSRAVASNSCPEHFIGFVSRLWVSICRLRPELLQNVLRQIWRVGFLVRLGYHECALVPSQAFHV